MSAHDPRRIIYARRRDRFARAAAFAVALIGSVLSAGCQTVPALAEVEATERARFQAWTRADIDAIQPVLADDLVYCHSTGQCQTKAELVAALQSRETVYRSMEVLELRPRAAAGAVVVNGKLAIQAESKGQATAFKGIYTDVYVKRDGRWQMIAWQSTKVP
jgi:ketosteroid isomerase-like protein